MVEIHSIDGRDFRKHAHRSFGGTSAEGQLRRHAVIGCWDGCGLRGYDDGSGRCLLQDGEIVADCIKCKTSLVQAKVHVLTDKLLVKLTECHIVSSITLLDEQYQCQASVLVVWERAFLVVDADSIVRLRVMRPMMGALPFLSNPLFLR